MATILCIDPNEQYAWYLCSHLKKAGYTCIYSKNGETLLELIEKHDVDLVLSEVMMGTICGFEIARRVRSHEKHTLLPVVLMSTMSEEDEVRHGYDQGVDAYLAKPVDPQVLLTCVGQKIAESVEARKPDPATGMDNSQKIKSSVQRAIILRTNFALVYIEMIGVPNFTRNYGVAVRDKAFKRMARLITTWAETAECSLFEVGHMGAGHFVCMIDPDKVPPFCDDIMEQWDDILKRLYPSASLPGNGPQYLSLVICATVGKTNIHTSHQYFDTLSHLRTKALASGTGGVFLDSRRKF